MGVCGSELRQMFGLGSETRLTDTAIPAPYGIVIGDPKRVPEGYDEVWVLNVHAIDNRGVVDTRGCTECVCDIYNVTVGYTGKPIPPSYPRGLECCFDDCHCALKPDYSGPERVLYMEYYVEWVDMSDKVVPVTIYILDVTDGKQNLNGLDSCKVEYTVPKCSGSEASCRNRIHNTRIRKGWYRDLHISPQLWQRAEPGNEEGYIVGMTTCYPTPGSVKVRAREKLRLASWYSNEQRHTGVMGLFYLLIDESKAPPPPQEGQAKKWVIGAFTFLGAFILIGAIVSRHLKMKKKDGPEYKQIQP